MDDEGEVYYFLVEHNNEIEDWSFFTLTYMVGLCTTIEQLRELQKKVVEALPTNNFSLRFSFDYTHMKQCTKEVSVKLEMRLIEIVKAGHYNLHGVKFNHCSTDLIYT